MALPKEIKIDPSWKGMIKWGGFSLFLAGVIVIVFIVGIGYFKIALPLEPLATLENPTVPALLFLSTLVGEFLLFPGFLALYFSLRDSDKVKMLMATVFSALSVIMFFVSRGSIIAISKWSDSYKQAGTAYGKAVYLASAEVVLKTQDVYSTIALTLLSIASIYAGSVMLKSKIFSRIMSYIVILAGIFSIITPFAVNFGIPLAISLIGLVLMLIWQITIGIKLFKAGNKL